MMDPESSVTRNKRCSLSFRPWVAMVPGCFTVSDGHVPFEMLGGTFDSETRVEAGWGAVGGGIGRCVHASAGTPSAPRTETHTHTHTRDALRSCAFCDAKQLQVIKIPPPSNLLNNSESI